jgi:hypothetical protein
MCKGHMRQLWWNGLQISTLASITWHLIAKQITFGPKLRILKQGWNVMWSRTFLTKLWKCQAPIFKGRRTKLA